MTANETIADYLYILIQSNSRKSQQELFLLPVVACILDDLLCAWKQWFGVILLGVFPKGFFEVAMS